MPVFKDHMRLPATAERGRAHIIDLYRSGNRSNPEDLPDLNDCIATTLDQMKQYPNALKDFFDQDVRSFKFSRTFAENNGATWVIWRLETAVIVSVL
jgi:hypothetical protein